MISESMSAPDGAVTGGEPVFGAQDIMGAMARATTGVKAEPVQREAPKTDASRKHLVENWIKEIKLDKKYYEKDFKRMREDQQYAKSGAAKEWVDSDKYTVPLINRQINLAVASLYAKNPRAQAKRKKKLRFKAWDGTKETALAAYQSVQMGDPSAMAILTEIEDARNYNKMMDNLGKTLEILFDYYTGENTPVFKKQMKQLVRRTKTCGVGYVSLGFQRALQDNPDVVRQIDDMTREITLIESKLADVADGVLKEDDAGAEELKTMLLDLQTQRMMVVREGVTFNFPKSTTIIPHRACQQISGWIGCDYVSEEFHMSPERVEQVYKIDVRNSYKAYKDGKPVNSGSGDTLGGPGGDTPEKLELGVSGSKIDNQKGLCCLWRVQSKRTGQVLTVLDGWPDFIEAPKTPDVRVNGFWTTFALIFNEVEDDNGAFPLSDVYYLRHPQREYNNARQGLREHRVANRPKYFTRKQAMEEKEKALLQNAPAHAIIELAVLEDDVNKVIQMHKPAPIDPNLYNTEAIMRDIQIGVGTQDANLGPTSGATATESSIAEHSRNETSASNVDDLDEFLTEIARAVGQIMLVNLTKDTVVKIVGPGAVWPEFNPEDIAEEVFLEIKAGSSGRPNKAAELANMERGMPFLLQLGGVNGTVLAKRYADLLDIDEEELIVEGLPSITALNAMAAKQASAAAQPGTGDAATDPAQQGAKGAQNQEQPKGTQSGPQPMYPVANEAAMFDANGQRAGA